MKVCSTCNAKVDDHVAFCPKCGSSIPSNHPVYQRHRAKEPISIGGWIGRALIPFIPFVGGIVYLIMLFIWSGSTEKEETFRNWAKAQLILMAVFLILTIILVILFASVIQEYLRYL